MTKIKTIIFMFFISTGIVMAQTATTPATPKKFRLGLKVSPNFSWFKNDSKNLSDGGFKLGFSYGLTSDYTFSGNYALSTELLVSTLNGKITFKDSLIKTGTTTTTKHANVGYEYKNRYLQIPLSLKLKTKEIGMITYFGQFGLAPGILIGSNANMVNTDAYSDDDRKDIETKDNTYEFTNFENRITFINIPLIVGAGLEYNLSGNTSVFGSVRFENGFTDLFLKDKNTKAFNKNFSVSVGVFF